MTVLDTSNSDFFNSAVFQAAKQSSQLSKALKMTSYSNSEWDDTSLRIWRFNKEGLVPHRKITAKTITASTSSSQDGEAALGGGVIPARLTM